MISQDDIDAMAEDIFAEHLKEQGKEPDAFRAEHIGRGTEQKNTLNWEKALQLGEWVKAQETALSILTSLATSSMRGRR